MIQTVLSALGIKGDDSIAERTKRRFERRKGNEKSMIEVNGKQFSLTDWSEGGAFFEGSDVPLALGQELNFTLKFKMRHGIVAVRHKGRVVRSAMKGAAVQFDPLTRDIKRQFDRVVDGLISENFMASQVAA